MGTNFYWHAKPPCPTCGHADEGKHIGKSSAGWVFALRGYEDEGISRLDDWIARFWRPGSSIKDEYGKPLTPLEMVDRIAGRMPAEGRELLRGHGGLGDRVVAGGPGTWDVHFYEFS